MLDRTETPAFHLVISLITAAASAVVRARITDMWLLSATEETKYMVFQCLVWLITKKVI
jgi:hypothetical protein